MYENLPIIASQYGISATVNISVSKKLQFKVYGTWQQTKLEKQITLEKDTVNITHKNTPSFYGGLTVIFAPTSKWNFYVGSYFYTQQTYARYWSSATLPAATAQAYATDHILGKVILDAKISYKFWKDNRVYIEGKNLLFNNSREFGFTDPIKTLILAGVNFNF
jgi:iron complex outermembrane receptor protein